MHLTARLSHFALESFSAWLTTLRINKASNSFAGFHPLPFDALLVANRSRLKERCIHSCIHLHYWTPPAWRDPEADTAGEYQSSPRGRSEGIQRLHF